MPVAPAGWLLALIPVMFTYSGWNAVRLNEAPAMASLTGGLKGRSG
jgi:hypothetical protein